MLFHFKFPNILSEMMHITNAWIWFCSIASIIMNRIGISSMKRYTLLNNIGNKDNICKSKIISNRQYTQKHGNLFPIHSLVSHLFLTGNLIIFCTLHFFSIPRVNRKMHENFSRFIQKLMYKCFSFQDYQCTWHIKWSCFS